MNPKYKIAIAAVVVIVPLSIGYGLFFIGDGMALGPCDGYGWGQRQKNEQITALKQNYKELVPMSLNVKSYQCDLPVGGHVEFELSHSDSTQFINALEKYYKNPSRNYTNLIMDRQIVKYDNERRTKISFNVPGFGEPDSSSFEIYVPDDSSNPVLVTLDAGNF